MAREGEGHSHSRCAQVSTLVAVPKGTKVGLAPRFPGEEGFDVVADRMETVPSEDHEVVCHCTHAHHDSVSRRGDIRMSIDCHNSFHEGEAVAVPAGPDEQIDPETDGPRFDMVEYEDAREEEEAYEGAQVEVGVDRGSFRWGRYRWERMVCTGESREA